MGDRYDMVVFGASGFTGQYVVEEMLRTSQNDAALRWAIAGRNSSKLQSVLDFAMKKTGVSLPWKVPLIICDVNDENSLEEMAKQAKVVLNCVGPFRLYGEKVVKACIDQGAHHLDISGEPQYLETMQLKYHSEAKAKGVYVVGACGFDSIPAEVGVMHLTDKFAGDVNDIECYISIDTGPNGHKGHYGTWESAIYGFAHRGELSSIRKELYPQRLPKPKYPQKFRSGISYVNEVKSWCVPFPGSDRSVVNRSQRFLNGKISSNPIQYMPYVMCPSLFSTLGLCLIGLIFGVLASCRCGRYLLLKFPRLFSFGMFSHEGATRQQIEGCKFSMTFIGKGWKDRTNPQTTEPDKSITTKVSGPEPGYIACSIFIIQAALAILNEKEKMPEGGGVYAPGAAFWFTDLVPKLQSNGIDFQLISTKE